MKLDWKNKQTRGILILAALGCLNLVIWFSFADKPISRPVLTEVEALASAASDGDVKALAALRTKAEQENTDAQYELGYMYDMGRGVLKSDSAEALKWFRRAADLGNNKAQVQLGWFYETGQGGVKHNQGEALRWFRKAVDQGEPQAYFPFLPLDAREKIGEMYEYGGVVKQDYAEAAKWYRMAADQQDKLAQWQLGEMYAKGEGVEQNYVVAFYWKLLARKYWWAEPDIILRDDADDAAKHLNPFQIYWVKLRVLVWKPTPAPPPWAG